VRGTLLDTNIISNVTELDKPPKEKHRELERWFFGPEGPISRGRLPTTGLLTQNWEGVG
jgi:hypothetical protein